MDPLNPIKPPLPSPRIRPTEGTVKRREPGTGADSQKKDNPGEERPKPTSDDRQIDELA